MKSKFKRALALCLALVMILSLLIVCVWACFTKNETEIRGPNGAVH